MTINLNNSNDTQNIYKNFDYNAIKGVKYNVSKPPVLENDKVELSTKKDTQKNKTKKVIALVVAATGIATAAILCIKKGKTTKLQDFDFKNIPSDFTGKVKAKLKGGDKLVMEYKNGVLISSARSGKKNVSKVFETVNNEKVVKKTVDGKTSTNNLTQAKKTIEKEQVQLKELLDKNDSLTSVEFSKKIQNIKNKSKKQQEAIDKIISDKKAVEEKIAEYNRINKDISEIIFKDGKPYLKDKPERNFFGTVHATLPNNDKVTMEYDGIGLRKAQRSGEVNYTKEYCNNHFPTEKTVKITKDGKVEEINLYQNSQQGIAKAKEAKLMAPVNEAMKKFEEAPEGVKKFEAKIEYLEAQKKYYLEKGNKRKVDEMNREIVEANRLKAYHSTSVLDLSQQETLKKSDVCYFGDNYFNIKNDEELYSLYTKNSPDYAFFLENKDLTLDSKVDLFADFDKRTYDIPERFAIMADNSLRQKGNAYVFESMPEVFDGIKQEDIFENLSKFARSDKTTKYIDFEISGKKFHATRIGAGEVGTVYKIEDDAGKKIAMKIFRERGKTLDMNSGLSEIATSRRLTQDKVGDVPQFYMANAGLYKLGKQGEVYNDSPWMLCEFIDQTKKPKAGSTKVQDWLSKRNMFYADAFKNGRQNGYLVDVGGMVSNNYEDRLTWGISGFQSEHSCLGLSSLLEKALKTGHSVDDILKTFHD